MTTLKTCNACKRNLPPTNQFFSNHRASPDGLCHKCKECCKAYMVQWRIDNREHRSEYDKKYYYEHHDRKMEYKKGWRERTKEQRREYSKRYRAQNRESRLTKLAEWRTNNANHRKNYKIAHRAEEATHARNRRARIKESGGQHTVADVQRQHKAQKGKCYWCGVKLGVKYHVDHVIPVAKGGTNDPSNLVVACPQCNQSKNDKYPWEWEGNKKGRLF